MSFNVRGSSEDSNTSLLEHLSCNIFLTNFPPHLTTKELWNTYGLYGTVLDVYILKKLSKQVRNLLLIHLSRIRNPKHLHKFIKGKEYLQHKDEPVMVLDYGSLDYEGNLVLVECIKDFKTIPNIHNSCDKFQKHSGINSWFSCIKQWSKDFEVPNKVVWIDVEGIPLQAWSHSTFNKIACKWGELVYMDDSNSSNKYSIRLCVKTRLHQLITESFKRLKLSLQEEDEDDEVVPSAFQHDASIHVENPFDHTAESCGDPFGLEQLILKSTKKGNKDPLEKNSTKPQFPPGFTLVNSNHQVEKVVKDTHEGSSVSVNNDDTYVPSKSTDQVKGNTGNDYNIESGSKNIFSKSHSLDHVDSLAPSSKHIEGFSILEHFHEFISVGQAMGFRMKGCKKDY
ncbi:RNA-directed DNA polymerase, eukaryota, reverse transcriptase zinc-binding domain protein [Tanacetum coccineum]